MDWFETRFKGTNAPYRYTVAHWCATEARFRNHLKKVKKDDLAKLIPLENMLVRITQQDVVYRRYLVSSHRSYVPDFGVYITIQGSNGDVEYRSLSRQLVLFCVERRKAWRMLQSKAGIENREYKAQRSVLADVDAGKISKEELFARAEELMRARVKGATSSPVSHAPRPAAPAPAAVPEAAPHGPAVLPAIGGNFATTGEERRQNEAKRERGVERRTEGWEGDHLVGERRPVDGALQLPAAVRERERHEYRRADRRRARRPLFAGSHVVPRSTRIDAQ